MKTRIITLLIAIFALVGSATAQKTIQVYKDGAVAYSEYVSDIDSVKFIELNNGHEYVDLGLSVKWATCNVGATAPEEYGDYFAWGETTTKSSYTSINYTYFLNPTTLPLSADAARVNWGGSWRMPTVAEQDELRNTDNCIWIWIAQNGVYGYKVISKKNGNSIFLPQAGYRNNSDLNDPGTIGYYWSSSLIPNGSNYAYYLCFSWGSVHRGEFDYRHSGLSVRAVCE